MLREWIQKHRTMWRKKGGMQEKLDAIRSNTAITTRILGDLNMRLIKREDGNKVVHLQHEPNQQVS